MAQRQPTVPVERAIIMASDQRLKERTPAVYRLQRHSLGLSTVRRCLSSGARVVASTSRLSASALALTALTLAVRSPLPSDKTQVQHAHHAVHLFSRYLLELAGLQPPLLWPQLEAHGAPQPPCTCTNYARCKQCR